MLNLGVQRGMLSTCRYQTFDHEPTAERVGVVGVTPNPLTTTRSKKNLFVSVLAER
jgi:hypothetical protein